MAEAVDPAKMRLRAASSEIFIAAPTAWWVLPCMKRRRTASRSPAARVAMAASRCGVTCSQRDSSSCEAGVLRVRGVHFHLPGFAAGAAGLFFEEIGSGKTGGVVEPAGENRRLGEAGGFLSENEKDRLRDIFSQMPVFHLAQGAE